MKHFVICISGLASKSGYSQYGADTPLSKAQTKNFDLLASKGYVGSIKVSSDDNPSTAICNLALLGYDVKDKNIELGPSSYEALSLNINVQADDLVFRTDFVSMTGKMDDLDHLKMEPTGVDFLSKEESEQLTYSLNEGLSDGILELYNGISYRGCAIFRGARANDDKDNIFGKDLVAPIKVMGKTVKPFLPNGFGSDIFRNIFSRSLEILKNHPVNQDRIYRKLLPANGIWLFGRGTKPSLPNFKEKSGFDATVVSDSNLVNGIAIAAGIDNSYLKNYGQHKWNDIEGYTKKIDYIFDNIDSHDFFYVQFISPNKYSHLNDESGKIFSIEKIDKEIGRLKEGLDRLGIEYTLTVVSDHVTDVKTGLSQKGVVPFLTYKSTYSLNNTVKFTENDAQLGIYLSDGASLIKFIKMC